MKLFLVAASAFYSRLLLKLDCIDLNLFKLYSFFESIFENIIAQIRANILRITPKNRQADKLPLVYTRIYGVIKFVKLTPPFANVIIILQNAGKFNSNL